MDKDTLYRFLIVLMNEYGTTSEYFDAHPVNPVHKKVKEFRKLCEDNGNLQVSFKPRTLNPRTQKDITSYDVSDLVDLSVRINEGFTGVDNEISINQITPDRTIGDSVDPSNPLFAKLVELYVDIYNLDTILPCDVITLEDMSYSIFEVLQSIEEHHTIGRLNKVLINDLYVKFEHQTLDVQPTKMYSDELLDELEPLIEMIRPYWFGDKLKTEVIPEEECLYNWNDIAERNVGVITNANAVHLCQTDCSILKNNAPAHINLVDMVLLNNRFVGLMLVRYLAHNKISISYKDVPLFKKFVDSNAFYLKEIRW